MLIGKLNVAVRVFAQQGNGPTPRKRTMTTIFVRMGGTVVGERTIPGKWNEAQAMLEFKRFPARFTPRATFNVDTLKAIAA